jgi:hypothetical protein
MDVQVLTTECFKRKVSNGFDYFEIASEFTFTVDEKGFKGEFNNNLSFLFSVLLLNLLKHTLRTRNAF